MKRPKICAVVTDQNLEAIWEAGPLVAMYEVRLDMVGPGWPELVKLLPRPWLACNRVPEEGGRWQKGETSRIEELLCAAEVGACMVDVELRTPNLSEIVPLIKQKTRCLISYHDLSGTPAISALRGIVDDQIKHGADVCKVVTTALTQADNQTVLDLIKEYPSQKMVSLAMGDLGLLSRVLSPLVGGYFTYASLARGAESAPGQMSVREMNALYEVLKK
jgi:3-dehydroquinate dehydratase I